MTTKMTQAERDKLILEHINAALMLKPRDSKHRPLKTLLTQAKDAITGKANQGNSPTDLEYRNSPAGTKLPDPNRSGLLMRVGKRAGRQWIFRHVHPTTQKQTEVVFGTFPDMSVSVARDVWGQMRAHRNAGGDPATILEQGTKASSRVLTMQQLVDRYLSEYAKPHKRPKSAAEDERLLTKHVLAHYADLPATQFGPDQMKAIIQPYIDAQKTNTAQKIVIVIRTMFDIATGRKKPKGVSIADARDTWLPGDLEDPTRFTHAVHENDTYAPTDDDAEWIVSKAIPDLTDTPADVLRLLSMTMGRISEVNDMRWSELDTKRGRWTIPGSRTKNKKPHLVILPRQAMAILETRKDAQTKAGITSDYVFPQSNNPDKPTGVNSVQAAFRKLRQRDNRANGLTPHSTRHLAETWLATNKARPDVRIRMLNHTPNNGAADTYNHATLNDEAREWWQKYADHLDALASENVVVLSAPKVKA